MVTHTVGFALTDSAPLQYQDFVIAAEDKETDLNWILYCGVSACMRMFTSRLAWLPGVRPRLGAPWLLPALNCPSFTQPRPLGGQSR